jgi:hypothetical protein
MKFIGQYIKLSGRVIQNLVARFRNDVYLEDISTGTVATGDHLGIDSNGKIVKTTVSSGSSGGGASATNDLSDVVSSGVSANDILVYSGGSFVVQSMQTMINNPSFYTFSVSSFDDGLSGNFLIGGTDSSKSGVWKAADAISFTATYVAGPPSTSATIQKQVNGGSYTTVNSMDSTAFTSGNNDAAISYPPARDQYIRFRLQVVNDGSTTETQAGLLYFRNNIYFGAITSTTFTTSGLGEALATSTSSFDDNRLINATANKYLYIAYPSAYADIDVNGFKFNSITCPFETKSIVSITNSKGFTENYDTYRSSNHSLGNSTLQLSTSSTLINHVFCGVTTSANPTSLSAFSSINQTIASNDITRTWDSVTAGSGKYVMFAWPSASRVNGGNAPTFTVGVLSGGFSVANGGTAVSYTNANGYVENYVMYVSNNQNLGTITVITS